MATWNGQRKPRRHRSSRWRHSPWRPNARRAIGHRRGPSLRRKHKRGRQNETKGRLKFSKLAPGKHGNTSSSSLHLQTRQMDSLETVLSGGFPHWIFVFYCIRIDASVVWYIQMFISINKWKTSARVALNIICCHLKDNFGDVSFFVCTALRLSTTYKTKPSYMKVDEKWHRLNKRPACKSAIGNLSSLTSLGPPASVPPPAPSSFGDAVTPFQVTLSITASD